MFGVTGLKVKLQHFGDISCLFCNPKVSDTSHSFSGSAPAQTMTRSEVKINLLFLSKYCQARS